jgi:mono/diheme cytochrome c family protein
MIVCLAIAGLATLPALAETPQPDSTVDYQRQIRPILAEHCWQCHGVDDKTREGQLRLDLRDAALQGGDSGTPAIRPGDAAQSEMLVRLRSDDPDLKMPPPHLPKQPSADEIALLERWIGQGAPYAQHWAFTPPVQLPLPKADASPIDAWIDARHQAMGITPSPAAPLHQLARRLYLDLIGLPPSPAELEAFEKEGLEATVDKLLDSPRYGEKWARHWLDVARYSDTNGYEKDLRREQWAWRDWVIAAIQNDMPYDQFVIEQIAGDLLPNATQDQVIATGFLRNSMINEEGAIVPEQFRKVEMFDRLDCIGKAVLGLTTQCAQCHTHKFDPISHDEYFGMFAFLNNTYEAQSWVYAPDRLQQLNQARAAVDQAMESIRKQLPDGQARLDQWTSQLAASRPNWRPVQATLLETISGLNHPTQEEDLSILMLGHTSNDVFLLASPPAGTITGIQLELLPHRDLPFGGPGRNGQGMWSIQEVELLVKKPGAEWEKQKLVEATADFSEPEQKSGDGKSASGPVAFLIDGKEETHWQADRGKGRRNQASVAVMQLETSCELPEGSEIKIVWRMPQMVGCCRWSLTDQPKPVAPPVDHQAVLAAWKAPDARSQADRDALWDAFSRTVPELADSRKGLDAAWAQWPDPTTSVLHLAERDPSQKRQTYLLERGEWDRPLHAVEPHVPQALHRLELGPDQPQRLALAKWLVSRDSPLAARVAVNRIWQSIFGEGLVETSEDFGTRAPVPEYLELLDHLAVDFQEHQWSQKRLIRQIVSSRAYQRSSASTPEQREKDPRNRYLTRGPRFRADAEVVRDIALAASGLMHHQIGGPPVIPPVPQNVLDYNYTYPGYWTAAQGPDRYRRTVYVFRKRSMPDPALSTLDAPNGDFACARRIRSNTPLAALTSLNEPIFVEAARALGLRIVREAGKDDAQRAAYGYLLCTGRRPSQQETQQLLRFIAQQRQRIADGWINAREVATGESGKLPEIPEGTTPQDVAAWALAGRVLLNLDETITKN